MLKRLNVTIFHPRMIAKLIIDKFLMIFFFFSVLFFLVGSASFLSTYKVKSITNVNKQYFLNQIKQQEVKNNFKM